MASFNSFLTFEGIDYPITICSQHVHQEVDHYGRPNSGVYGGELSITLVTPSDVALLAWTVNPTQAKDCQVRFSDINSPLSGVVLILENAFCVSYAEHFEPDAAGQIAYYLQLSIVAEKINKQGTTFDNGWTASAK